MSEKLLVTEVGFGSVIEFREGIAEESLLGRRAHVIGFVGVSERTRPRCGHGTSIDNRGVQLR